jgi:hypothetical protein
MLNINRSLAAGRGKHLGFFILKTSGRVKVPLSLTNFSYTIFPAAGESFIRTGGGFPLRPDPPSAKYPRLSSAAIKAASDKTPGTRIIVYGQPAAFPL